MQVNDLKNKEKKDRKRVGRGGKKGTYSGKGMKGQKSRSGYSKRATFEGGKSSLIAHTKKKKGFKSLNAKAETVDLETLERKFVDGEEVTKELLKEKKLIKSLKSKVKILSDGEIKKKLIVGEDILTSETAKDKIKKAGGEVIEKEIEETEKKKKK
jgi:large subunit ribosomal protein L15